VAFFKTPGCSSWFPGILGAEVNDLRDGSLRRCFAALLYLAAKPAYMGVDVDGLACPLHHPMAYCLQTRGYGLLPGNVLSRHCSGAVAPFRGM
jgi:hypothetical protein